MLALLVMSGCIAEPESTGQDSAALIGTCGTVCADEITLTSDHPTATWDYVPLTYNFNGQDNNTAALGWNVANHDNTEPRIGLYLESAYLQTPVGPNFMEAHIQGWFPAGITRRPFTAAIDRDTMKVQVGMGGRIWFQDSTQGKYRMILDDAPSGQVALHWIDVIQQWEAYNVPMLRGLNQAGNGYIEVARIGFAAGKHDQIRLAPYGHDVAVQGPLAVAPDGSSKKLAVDGTGIGLHGKAPQPQCQVSDSDTATMVAELLQCLHDRGDVNWAGAQ